MIQINGDLTNPEADQLRAVLDGREDFFSARVFVQGRMLTLLVALEGAAPPAPAPEAPAFVPAVQPKKPGWPGGGPAHTPVSTGGASAEPGPSPWEDVTAEGVVKSAKV